MLTDSDNFYHIQKDKKKEGHKWKAETTLGRNEGLVHMIPVCKQDQVRAVNSETHLTVVITTRLLKVQGNSLSIFCLGIYLAEGSFCKIERTRDLKEEQGIATRSGFIRHLG